tara:strand:- start:14428 stop:19446 length:5019 start_codon:yes stop_codon:yes gene_type:complete
MDEIAAEEGPIKVSSFYWYFRKEEIQTVVDENGREQHHVMLDIGGADRRFIPTSTPGAKAYFHAHPDADGLRSSGHMYQIGQVNIGSFDDTPDEDGNVPTPPVGFLPTPDLYDLSQDYEGEFDAMNIKGVYLETPINFMAKVFLRNEYVSTASKVVRSVGIKMMSPEEIEAMSVLRVNKHSILTSTAMPTPVAGGPADGHLGASDRSTTKCLTCDLKMEPNAKHSNKACQGHFGHIDLAEPVPHVLFAISNDLTNVLNMFCHHCFRIPVSDEKLETLIQRSERIHKHSKNASGLARIRRHTKEAIRKAKVISRDTGYMTCPHCDQQSPVVEWDISKKMFLLEPYKKGSGGNRFYPYSTAHMLLQSVSDSDARLMGFDAPEMRPEYMFLTKLPVAPNNIRPMQEDFKTGKPMENDLTLMYGRAVFYSNRIREAKAAGSDPGRIQTTMVKDLFMVVAHCFFNQNKHIGMYEAKSVRTKAGSEKQTIRAGVLDKLSGYGSKKTAFRRRINSKVVNNVIRSVITASGGLSINEVGVPKVACLSTFVRVKVTEENYEQMLDLVIRGFPNKGSAPKKNGPYTDLRYPGAQWVEPFGDAVTTGINVRELSDRPIWNSKVATGKEGRYTVEGWTTIGEEWLEYKETIERPKGMDEDEKWEQYLANEMKNFEWEANMQRRAEMYGKGGMSELKVGDIVARTVLPGDYVIFGRQPSLHRQSLNGLRVVPLNQHAISFNPAICVPFNADFDGDQMNIYVPGSEEAMNEIRDKMQLKDNMLHHRMGKLVIGTDHDQTSGVYLLTMKHKSKAGTFDSSTGLGFDEDGVPYFSKAMMNNMFQHVFHTDDKGEKHYVLDYGTPDRGKFYSGYRCISLLLPDGINARFKSGIMYNPDGTIMRDEKEKPVKDETVIIDGEVITGTLDRTFMGKEKGTLAPAFYYRFGYEEGANQMCKFVDMLCRLGFAAHHALGYSMGVADCGVSKDMYEEVRSGYEEASAICAQINTDFVERNMQKYVDDPSYLPSTTKVEKQQILDKAPYQFRQMLIYEAQEPWEDATVRKVSDIAGSDNAMEIAVRSGGRGKELNIQQMGAAYGQVRISGSLPLRGLDGTGYWAYPPGINPETDEPYEPEYVDFGMRRQFSHYPLPGYDISHPIHHGFVKNSYYTGMEPHEYFTISIAGRRSDMESSSGSLQDSGYLANKVRRGLESLVVDKHRRVIDLRDNSIVSFKAGGDGFRPYSAKMVHRFPDGQVQEDFTIDASNEDLTIELQPYFFDFQCKHGVPLGMDCDDCAKGSAHIDFFAEQVNMMWQNERLTNAVIDVLAKREVMKPTITKMIEKLNWWASENLVQEGEAIGSTAAGCLAEPATQASLRTFHAGGKGAGTSVTRLEQVVEATDQGKANIQLFTRVTLQPEYWNDKDAQKIANWATPLNVDDVLEVVDYDIDSRLCMFMLDVERMKNTEVDRDFLMRQVKRALKAKGVPKGELVAELADGDSFVIKVDGKERDMINMKDYISLVQVSGLPNGGNVYIEKVGEEGALEYRLLVDSAHPKVWQSISELLTDFVQVDTLWCDNPKTVEQFLGLEAALACTEDQLNYQMNSGSGIGDYDYRYVRTIVDAMGTTGKLVGHGPTGKTGPYAKNTFDALAMEDLKTHLRAGVTMGNVSEIRSVTGSTIAGRVPLVGEVTNDYL